MKPLFRILLFIFIVGFSFFSGCQKPDDSNTCNDPIKEWPFLSTASRWLFDPIKVGDMIKFNVYHRNDRSSPYVYRRSETFMVKDTGIQKVTQPNAYTNLNCNELMIGDYLVADITGPESLTCELDYLAYTDLLITLQGENFGVGDIQYQAHQVNWNDSLVIGGQKFYSVKNFQGIEIGTNNYYVDSTYCFYNLQYGMLKFIINDTLIYQRTLH